MKASLQLKYSQNLTMTPQLQQAIKLLQLSSLELEQEIQNMLETNPMLEQDEGVETPSEDLLYQADSKVNEENSMVDLESFSREEIIEHSPTDVYEDVISDPSQDEHWDRSSSSVSNPSNNSDNDFTDFESRLSEPDTLSEQLLTQLNLCKMSDRDLEIAYLIIESLDSNGYLDTELSELLKDINEGRNPDSDSFDTFEIDEFYAVLHRIQQFEPTGVAAQNLEECLSLQLKQLPTNTPFLKEALMLVKRYLNFLGSKDFIQIRRKTKLNENTLRGAIKLIQSLNPYPGSIISEEKTEYITPDIIIRKYQGTWIAELNEDTLPKIRINNIYASYIKRSDNSADGQFLKNNLQEARWFIKSLQSRHETLLIVAKEILRIQQDFFEYGAEAMKPLVLHDIAELVDMHESTISRVTTQKYMLTPKGVFELKYFFSSHVSTNAGGECSSTAIRALIKKMVAAENRTKPLSDSKISTLLASEGIKVARRTIAKYRESLSIPPSNERKQLL
jgi:RNA polymerase sigma-54 factor